MPLQKIARLGLLKKISYFFILSVDIPEKLSIINHAAAVNAAKQMEIAGLCKGSTTDSDSVCEGSNPSPAAKMENPGGLDFQGFRGFLSRLFGFIKKSPRKIACLAARNCSWQSAVREADNRFKMI